MKTKQYALRLAVCALCAFAVNGETVPFTCTGNPIVKTTFTPDPAGFVDGDTFYLFTGHDEPDARGFHMKNWQVFRTKDMVQWENLGCVMDTSVFTWALQGNRAWASQAIKRNGKWYWYVAVAGNGRDAHHDCIGVAVADRPEGPWRDGAGKPLASARAGYIDPSVFVDDDGQAWLFWGNCGGDPGCWYAPLKENMVELAGEIKPVPGLMDEAAFGKPLKKKHGAGAWKPIDTHFEEAPWIYKVGDIYYLEYAAGGVPEHWAYSWAKSIHGPWHYGGRIMDEAVGTGTIHGGSVLFKGQWYMVYHNATLPGGADCRRSACIERYTRNADGSIPFIPATAEGVLRPAARFANYPDNTVNRLLAKTCAARGIAITDWHVHIRGGMTPELAVERENASFIRSSALENHGREWPINDNAKLRAFIDQARAVKVNGRSLPVGIQVNDRDWFRQIDKETLARLDYVLADTMIMGKMPDGSDNRLWKPQTITDPEAWMERYMAHNLQILGEPISILANPTYLPECLADRYDTLWTEERMRQIIAKAVERGIALEIQAESLFPRPKFLRLAKAMGAKFSFGTNNFDPKPKDLSRWLEVITWLDLHGSDIWTPADLKR